MTHRTFAAPTNIATDLEVVLLDYGGTLDGDAQHWFDHFVRLYAEAGADVPYPAIKTAFYAADAALERHPDIRSFGLERMIRTHVGVQLSQLDRNDQGLARRLGDAFIADTRGAWDRNRPLLGRLAARFRLGVVSNSYGNMPALLEEAALAPFELILDSSIEGIAKPDPALYALAVERLATSPAAILHVGDSWERDVVPADRVGLRTAWLARPAAMMPTEPATWRLATLLELEALLA